MTFLAGSLFEFAGPLLAVSQGTAGALIAGLWQGLLLSVGAGLLLQLMPKGTGGRCALRSGWQSLAYRLRCRSWTCREWLSRATRGVAAASHLVIDPRWSYLLSGLWLVASVWRMVELGLQASALRSLWRSAVPVPRECLDGP